MTIHLSRSAIATICHEANAALCGEMGDMSQKPWDFSPEWQRDSAVMGVNFLLDNPGAGDSATHDSWAKQKVAEGWVYGPEKDAEKKTHPCLVPFEGLPPHQQAKDRLFRAIVTALKPLL